MRTDATWTRPTSKSSPLGRLSGLWSAYFDQVEMYYQYFPDFWEEAGAGIPRELTFEDVAFHRIEDVPHLATEAFALVAVATRPR